MLGALIPLLACTSAGTAEPCEDDCLADVGLTVSEVVPMAVRATWTVGASGTCQVAYREVDGDWRIAPEQDCEPGSQQSRVLRGLHVDTEVEVEVVLTVDGIAHPPSTASTTTGSLPDGVPTFEVVVPWSGEGDGGYVQGSFSEDTAGAFILDRDARYVYLWTTDQDQLRDVFNARLAPDLSSFWLLLNERRVTQDWGLVVQRDWFGSLTRKVEVPRAHHDLVPLADGSVLVIEGDPDDAGRQPPIWGDRVVRIHPDSEVPATIWSSWDDLVPPDSAESTSPWYGDGVDWIHGNSLAYSAARQTVLLGSPQLNALYEIDVEGAGLSRTLGGEGPDGWQFEGTPFQHPHASHWNPDGTLALLSTDWATDTTSAVELRLDADSQTLVPTWSFTDPSHYAHLGGSTSWRGDDGHRLINYGSDLYMQEVDEDGTVIWGVEAAGTSVIFQAWPLPDLWAPAVE